MPYTPPKHYTAEELRSALVADLVVDLYCAERDGLVDYADRVREDLHKVEAGEQTEYDKFLIP